MKNSPKNIIDHIQKNNLDPGSIAIAKILITSFKEVHQEYQEAIEEEKKNEKGINQNNQLRILNNEILDFEKKKEGLAQCASLHKGFIEIIQRVEGKDVTTVHTYVIKTQF